MQCRQHPRAGLDENHPRHAGIDDAIVARDHIDRQLLDSAGELDPGGPCADDDEGEVRRARTGIRFDFRALERAQQARADEGRLLHGLHPRRKMAPLLVPEVVVDRTRREHQIVVADSGSGGAHLARGEVHCIHLREQHARVLLVAQDGADRLGDVRRGERRGGDLVEQGLQEVIVVAVDDEHVGGRAAQRPGGEQAAEAATDDHDPRPGSPRQQLLRSHAQDVGAIIRGRKPARPAAPEPWRPADTQ